MPANIITVNNGGPECEWIVVDSLMEELLEWLNKNGWPRSEDEGEEGR